MTERYLELLKQSLLGLTGQTLHAYPRPTRRVDRAIYSALAKLLSYRHAEVMRKIDASVRDEGGDWPANALTMIGRRRLDNIHDCIRAVIVDQVPGDFIEAGVWRGGACIFMRAALLAYGDDERRVWVADSFRGLPAPDASIYPADAGDQLWKATELAVPLDQVKANFELFDLLDDRVVFLPGWFRDTLPRAPIAQLALVRLDGDLYESTIDSLQSLYPKLSKGGFLIVDDYGNPNLGCHQAVDDFRTSHGISEPLTQIDWTGWYWRRG